MDMINFELVKKLRNQRSWSQEQLAAISGLSLRTIQRIEKTGACSLESKKAIASAFEIDAASLDVDEDLVDEITSAEQPEKPHGLGAAIGISFALLGVSLGLYATFAEAPFAGRADIWLGVFGAIVGSCSAAAAVLINRRRSIERTDIH